jgi:twinkle protein
VYHVKLQKKDANDYLTSGSSKEFVSSWWAAKRFLPEGVISTFAEIDDIIDTDEKKESVPYPFPKLTEQTYGIRTGEVVLLKAQEGIGKTEILRAIEYHLLKTTDANIGVLHLEEDKARTLKGLAGYELRSPVHLPDTQASKSDIKRAIHEVLRRDERVHIYTHFGSDDPDVILNTIRFMAGPCSCKYIFLDHITMVVTGLLGEDERKALDYISTRLAMMVKELDFCLFLVSHVNDEGQTRGSRNIGKVSHLTLSLDRNLLSDIPSERNTTRISIEKNRFASKTGPSSRLLFDESTFMVEEQLEMPI